MTRMDRAVRIGGAYLASASALMIAALVLHGPIAPDVADQMSRIAGAPGSWVLAHWLAAASLSLYVVAALMVLTAGSRLTEGAGALAAWSVLALGSLWVLPTAISEATAVTRAAVSGDAPLFELWWSFAEGHANGVVLMALAIAGVAALEARRPDPLVPRWAAVAGVVVAVASPLGWVAGMWLEVRAGNVLWVIATVLMSAWTLWLGAALVRRPAATRSGTPSPAMV